MKSDNISIDPKIVKLFDYSVITFNEQKQIYEYFHEQVTPLLIESNPAVLRPETNEHLKNKYVANILMACLLWEDHKFIQIFKNQECTAVFKQMISDFTKNKVKSFNTNDAKKYSDLNEDEKSLYKSFLIHAQEMIDAKSQNHQVKSYNKYKNTQDDINTSISSKVCSKFKYFMPTFLSQQSNDDDTIKYSDQIEVEQGFYEKILKHVQDIEDQSKSYTPELIAASDNITDKPEFDTTLAALSEISELAPDVRQNQFCDDIVN